MRCFLSRLAFAVLCLGLGLPVDRLPAQQPQRNAGFEARVFAITNARLVISPDEEIEKGTLVIRDGLIVAAGRDVNIPPEAENIDGAGLVVYPGFIDGATSALIDPNRIPPPAAGRPIDFSRFALAATPPDNRKRMDSNRTPRSTRRVASWGSRRFMSFRPGVSRPASGR
jgi:hypothetical protein